MKKTAVVLFNLGGPESEEGVRPFLFNLFCDPFIIRLPKPLRLLIALLIAWRRTPIAKEIYAQIGGKSPILAETKAQARALEEKLQTTYENVKVFVAMRYSAPFAYQVMEEVQRYQPEEVLLLPLYPQMSTTTTASFLNEWKKTSIPAKTLCCYPTATHFVSAHVEHIASVYKDALKHGKPRVLFSAHGLPQKIVDAGDPYQWQVEQSVNAIVKALDIKDLDWRVTYQSRVGPMKWLEPNTSSEIQKTGEEGLSLVIVPIAFVSEHSETLVELDIEYKKLAEESGVSHYYRVPTLRTHELFISQLASLCVYLSQKKEGSVCSSEGTRLCPASFSACIHS